jgi:hypothetical protein
VGISNCQGLAVAPLDVALAPGAVLEFRVLG